MGSLLCALSLLLLFSVSCVRWSPPRVGPSPAGPCRSAVVTWLAPEDVKERGRLDSWCAGVGDAALHNVHADAPPPANIDEVTFVSWNVHVGNGDVRAFVRDLTRGTFTGGRPVSHYVLLLQEAVRTEGVPPLRAGASGASRIRSRPAGEADIVRTSHELGLSLVYVPLMRNGRSAGDPAEDRGSAILSTLPVSDPIAVELPGERERRVVVFARIGSFHAGVIHLDVRGGAARLGVFWTPWLRDVQVRSLNGHIPAGPLVIVELKADGVTSKATLQGDELTGEAVFPNRTVKWTAVRIPPRPSSPRTHEFEPAAFHRYFSSTIPPGLRIHPGDTVRTWTVDAGGRDRQGTARSGGGNPQTGPFYIEGAVPNDTLVVRLIRVRTNRDWAGSGTTIMTNALEPGSLGQIKWAQDFPGRWKLDAARNVAYLEQPTDALKALTIPMRPMLGCVAVAPPGESAIRTTDSGRFGGNMDYNEIREGTTVYLPISHPGALLFVGDGHAAQGDGELTGDALETSMDVEFTVDLIPGRNFGHPLAENSDFLISIGIGGSVDQALQQATSGMVRWLERDYKLNANESAMVLGFAVKYDIVDLVGTQVSVAAKVPRTIITQLVKK